MLVHVVAVHMMHVAVMEIIHMPVVPHRGVTAFRQLRRREFISVIAGAAAWPLGARAEQPAMPVIGFLNPAPAAEAIPHLIAAFRRGLADAGYVQGKNLAVKYRFGNYKLELLSELARDLVHLNVNVIF